LVIKNPYYLQNSRLFYLKFPNLFGHFPASIQLFALLFYAKNFLFASHTHFDYKNAYEDRQGFVGTPGPAMWRGSPACFAAERPSLKVSFFRVFGPRGP
jgi:hypothetical protein